MKRSFSTLVAVALVLTLLAACGPKASPTPAKETQVVEKEVTKVVKETVAVPKERTRVAF